MSTQELYDLELYDLEGEPCPGRWGQFVDLSDPTRKNIYKQVPPKIKPYITPIYEEEEYEFEENDYQLDIIPKISTVGILMNTVYILHYVLCKLPGKFWSS